MQWLGQVVKCLVLAHSLLNFRCLESKYPLHFATRVVFLKPINIYFNVLGVILQ